MSYKKKQTGNQPYYASFLKGDSAAKTQKSAKTGKPASGKSKKLKGKAAFANSGEFSPRRNTMYGKQDAYRPQRNPAGNVLQGNNDRSGLDRPAIDRKETNRSINRSFEDRPNRKDNDSRPVYKGNNDRAFRPRPEGNDRSERPAFRPRTEGGDRSERPAFRPRPEGNDRSERPAFRPRTEGGDRSERPAFRPRPEGNDRSERPAFRPRPEGNDRSERPAFRPRPEGNDRSERPAFRPRTEGGDRSERPVFRPRPEGNDRSGRPAFRPRTEGNDRSERPAFRPRRDDNDRSGNEPKRERDTESRRVGRHQNAPNYDMSRAADRSTRVAKQVKKKDNETDGTTRLNKYIANSGVCSRREADELIEGGKISINGKTITELGYKVNQGDVVKHENKVLNPEKLVYLLMNKPKGFITTTEDPDERKTVMDLIEGACNERIYPVGRLDRNTTGLLLFTNDGDLAGKLMHPSNQATKIYQAELDKPITPEHFEQIKAGLELEDGFIKPDDVALVTPDAEVIGIEIHSGKNRIVRRIFEHLGYDVQKLDRTVYAGLTKKELPRGHWRFLSEREVVKLKYLS